MKAQLEDRISVDREKTANVEHRDRLDALKALVLTGRATLTEAAQFWIDHHPDKRTDPFTPETLKQAIDWYLIDKRKDGRKPRYVRDLRFTLEKVNRTFTDALSLAITQEKFERWLDLEKMTPITRKAYIRDVSGLLRFCAYKKWIKENPLEHIRRPKVKLQAPEIFTVDEADKLLKAALASTRRPQPKAQRQTRVFARSGLSKISNTASSQALAKRKTQRKSIRYRTPP